MSVIDSANSSLLIRGDETHACPDPAVLFRNGRFYLYRTLAETEADGAVYMYTAAAQSEDLVRWNWK